MTINSRLDTESDIHLLPEHIIDQIKAGEVIERPATLLKELLENSIDAGSTKISIHIINNGLDLISVEDNGSGINFDDLPLAFCRHATSKLTSFEDLYELYTYGFRGEALASMASVSKITCSSNKKNHSRGIIKFHGGEMISHIKEKGTLANAGSQIFVKDLFYNTPVRMKFMQSQTTEKNHLKKMVNAFLLTHPEIEFSVKWDENTKMVYPIVTPEEISKRVKKIFEKKKDPLELLTFSNEYDGIKARVVLSLNSSKGNAGKFQYIFINDRYVQDTQMHKVAMHSAQNLWPFGQSGNYIIFIELEPNQLDVNVHPNKTVIKLFQPNKVLSLLSSTIKQNLPKQNASYIPGQSTNQNNNFLDQVSSDQDFKEVNYREQNFTSQNALTDYFSQLDRGNSNEQSQEEYQIIYKDKNACLYKKDNHVYLLDIQKAFLFFIEKTLNSNADKSPIPLLVSSPLSLKKAIPKERFELITSEGYELDYLDKETLVIRSFPKYLSHLPYEEILQLLLDPKNVFINNAWILGKEEKLEFNITDSYIRLIVKNSSITTLLEAKVLKQIIGKDLLKLL